jgi:DNA excision repair protein ERCC-2
MSQPFRAAIRDMVEFVLRHGDLNRGAAWGVDPGEAIRIHQEVQSSRPDGYQREVPIQYQVANDDVTLNLSGRIDGVWKRPDGVVIEEIKTVPEIKNAPVDGDPIHWAQAQLYAFIYAQQNFLDSVRVRLTYVSADTGERHELEFLFTLAQLETAFNTVVNAYLDWAARVVRFREERDESLQKASFPFDTLRPGQEQIVKSVRNAILERSRLFLQAPTGLGKTMGVMFPAIQALGTNETDKIYFLTARNTGHQAAEQALAQMHDQGCRFKALTLTARQKICSNDPANCGPDTCDRAQGHFDRINKALTALFEQDVLSRQIVEQIAKDFRVCPFELGVEAAIWADIIIGDYNYVFDPTASLKRSGPAVFKRSVCLIDEAHNLVDRAREMLSAEIRLSQCREMEKIIKDRWPDAAKGLSLICKWFKEEAKQHPGNERAWEAPDSLGKIIPLVNDFLESIENHLSDQNTPWPPELADQYFDLAGFRRTAAAFNDGHTAFFERDGRDLRYRLFCLDPSDTVRRALPRQGATIFFSATLSPIEYYQDVLGGQDKADQITLPSPFPPDHLGLWVADGISTLYRQRNQTKREVVEAITALVQAKPGRYMVFMPSHSYMNAIWAEYSVQNPEMETVVQTRTMLDDERQRFLDCFESGADTSLVGFAVMGGIFGEGVDLCGDRLSGAVVVGLGLPALSPERQLIRHYFDDRGDRGYDYAFLYPGLCRVFQAVGRVIRSDTDQGAVLLIDPRFSEDRINELFPEHWRPNFVNSRNELAETISAFWMDQERNCQTAISPAPAPRHPDLAQLPAVSVRKP